jgi:galactokinase
MDLRSAASRAALRRGFEARYGAAKSLRCALAPGRVNLIGEHTDYNGGFVLPMAIDRHTAVLFQPGREARIRVHAALIARAGGAADDEFGLTKRELPVLKDPGKRWANYARGVAAALLRRGVQLRGGDLFITGDLPLGAGLSSSAALEIGVGLALLALAGRKLPPWELALAGQEAEHAYAGIRCGIMDQTVVSRARAGSALLLDCATLEVRHVPARLKGWAFAVFDTGVKHQLAASEYNRRRAECERAAETLGAATLRDVTIAQLLKSGERLTPGEHLRARHVLTENLRALQFAAALGRGDVEFLGRLLEDGHLSLARDYQVSCAELDWLQRFLVAPGGKLRGGCAGARMIRQAFRKAPGAALLVEPTSAARVERL